MKYILYHGTSSYLSLEAVHLYIEEIKKKKTSSSISIVEADSITSQNIIDLLTSPSLFTSKRIIFLKRIYRNKERKTLTEAIIEILKESKGDDLVIFW